MVPYTFWAGYILLKQQWVSGTGNWFTAGIILLTLHFGIFVALCALARFLRRRLPADTQLKQRLICTVGLCLLLTITFLNLQLRLLEGTGFMRYRYREAHFWSLFAALGTLTVFLVFVREIIFFLEQFKTTAIETQTLKKEYTRSRLSGLQSQANPHFLFNNLNTLSSLIQEQPLEAEYYLDELSKVYRYLLRHNDAELVPLNKELNFMHSLKYLLQQRHGSGLQINIDPLMQHHEGLLPPLTLQMIVEQVIAQNSCSKSAPLVIHISTNGSNWLELRHNLQLRVGLPESEPDEHLDNIINKIHLLCREEVLIRTSMQERVISIPLITAMEEVLA